MTPTRRGVLAGGAAALAVPAAAEPAAPAAAHPCLWYDRPAAAWTEALPVGNGLQAAMMFGTPARERLQLNHTTLYAGGPYDPVSPDALAALPEVRRLIFAGRYKEAEALIDARMMARPIKQMPFQTAGDLFVEQLGVADGGVSAYRRELDLDRGTAGVGFDHAGTRYGRALIASPVDGVLAMRLRADGPAPLDLRVTLAPGQPGSVGTDAAGRCLVYEGTNRPAQGIPARLRVAMRVAVEAPDAEVAAEGEALRVRGGREAVLLVGMDTSYRGPADLGGDPAALTAAAVERAAGQGWRRLLAAHVAEHRRLFRGCSLDLGRTPAADLPTDRRVARMAAGGSLADDPDLAALYFAYGRYLLLSSSRPGGQPANLQGIWNDSNTPPWDSKYTININTQMNYWPAEATGLAECVEPLIRMVEELAASGARTARAMYGARGWVAHHNTDLWRASAPIDGAQWGMWPTGGAWLCVQLWSRWEHGRDPAFLARLYPLLRGAALFFLDALVPYPGTDRLVTSPSLSPENIHPHGSSICAGPTMDMQILRDLFDRAAAAAGLLGRDADLAAAWRAARARLVPNRVGAQGQLMEWIEDWDAAVPEPHHRHVSHLYGLYPGNQIDPVRTPDLAAAARRTLEQRGDDATGWGLAWRLALWARLGDGEHAYAILRRLLSPGRTYPNLFDAHPPFQIDGNLGGVAGLVEMLVQAHGREVRLLPALPSAWPAGRIAGIRLAGGGVLDLEWRRGRAARARLVSRDGGEWRLLTASGERVVATRPGRAAVVRW